MAICLNSDANKVGKGPHKRPEVAGLKEGSCRANPIIYFKFFERVLGKTFFKKFNVYYYNDRYCNLMWYNVITRTGESKSTLETKT